MPSNPQPPQQELSRPRDVWRSGIGRRGRTFDAMIVGARCAGAATAMLLARQGFDVLLVDRARFPSEIPRGHYIRRDGPQRLAEWGLLERVLATGCPPITSMTIDLGDFPLTGTGLSDDGVPSAWGHGGQPSTLCCSRRRSKPASSSGRVFRSRSSPRMATGLPA